MKSKEPVYMIGVAARILNIHPQTLRMYEREKLLVPKRTNGSTRLYSEYDIECVKEIQHMTQDMGLNLAGVRLLLEMKQKTHNLAEQIQKYQNEMLDLQNKMDDEIEKVHKSYKHEVVLYKQSPLALLRQLMNAEKEEF